MAHLLMLESWVGGTGRILPSAIQQLGHRFTFVTRNRQHYLDPASRQIHPVLEYADNVLTTETNDVRALIPYLRQQHAILGFDGVFTICDYYIDTAAQVAEALDLPPAFSSNVTLERQKHCVREALQRAGLPNPLFRITESWLETQVAAAEIGYPLVLKPTDLASSAFVSLVTDERELHQAFAAITAFPRNFRDQPREQRYLLEAYMTGPEVSVESCTFQGDTTIIGITDKSVTGSPFFIEDGHMFPADLDPTLAAATCDFVRQALQAVGHDHGLSHTEVKLTPDGPRLVEINPRPGGNYIAELVRHVTGIDLLAAQIDLALGRRPQVTPIETGVASAAIAFIVPPRGGTVVAIHGADTLDSDPSIVRWVLNPVAGSTVPAPIDNACYLGHVVTIDQVGPGARALAEQAVARIDLVFDTTHDPAARSA